MEYITANEQPSGVNTPCRVGQKTTSRKCPERGTRQKNLQVHKRLSPWEKSCHQALARNFSRSLIPRV